MNNKAKAGAETPALAVSNTAFAASDVQTHYPANGCGTQGEFHNDVPQLPYRM
ncbi:MAG TPA: hypothetical protein VKT81_04020 [Bryobacteraceae bacterium]|nr:hypothetical protein [Bryobacteraceae bacterium]